MVDKNSFLIDLTNNLSLRCWRVDFTDLTHTEQVFQAVWALEGEVNNGGFDQYYFNSSGDTAFAVEDALVTIGATQCAAIVHKANSLFRDGRPPKDREARQEQLDALSDDAKAQLDSLDQEFYEYPDNLTDLLYDYLMAHRDQFQGLE